MEGGLARPAGELQLQLLHLEPHSTQQTFDVGRKLVAAAVDGGGEGRLEGGRREGRRRADGLRSDGAMDRHGAMGETEGRREMNSGSETGKLQKEMKENSETLE